jgi:S-(hydroxymethyl)glutathione dehydrogenase/alcohol dehydrogenase
MELAYKCVRNDGGKAVLIGVPLYQENICIAASELFDGKSIIGTNGGSTNPDIDFPRYVELYLSGKLKLDQMITHRFKLHEINDALDLLRKGGEIGKAIVEL